MNCNRCGAANRDGSAFCKRCGNPLRASAVPPGPQGGRNQTQSAEMLCPNCGRQIRRDAAFCKYCGVSFRAAGASPKDPWLGLRIVLALLCVGMIVFGVLTVPGKLRERRDGGAQPAKQPGAAGQTTPVTPTGAGESTQSTPASETANRAARYAQIDAMLENGELEEPEPVMHDDYGWFSGDPEGWVAVTEEGGEAP